MINFFVPFNNNVKLANDITEWYDNNELRLIDVIPITSICPAFSD